MSEPLRFAQCELHVQTRRLLIAGAPATLGARAFDVLRVLVQHHDRAVPKDELLDAVWPGLDVEEGNLPVQISSLRKLLGPAAIATVPGRGYRFTLMPVLSVPSADQASSARSDATDALQLPVPATALIGRHDEILELLTALERHALVSVVGGSGVGKTRLALACAHRRIAQQRHGVCWVDVAQANDAASLAVRVGATLNVPVERASEPLTMLAAALRHRELLLVLDNCEHLIEPAATLARTLMAAAPGLRLLTTSQEPLKLPAEQVMRLDALAVPPAGTPMAEALQFDALALLMDRAQASDRRFALTEATLAHAIDICQQLDGNALAIEMAAARLPWMGAAAVQARLGDRLRLLASDTRGARHRSLQAALEWSHGLLSPTEQTVFRRLAVFHGGFTLETAAQVVQDAHVVDHWDGIDALGALVDKSLVHVMGDRQAPILRYRLLESARLFASACLEESAETLATQERHAAAFSLLASTAYEQLWHQADAAWLALYQPDIDNFRAALAHAVLCAQTDQVLPLVETIGWLNTLLSGGVELQRWCEPVLALAERASPAVAQRLFLFLGSVYRNRAPAKALLFYQQGVDRSEPQSDPTVCFKLLCALALCLARTGQLDQAAHHLAQAQALQPRQWPARVQLLEADAAGFIAIAFEQVRQAQGHFQRFHDLAAQAGAHGALVVVQHNLADLALQLGDADEAVRRGQALVAQLRRDNHAYNLGFALGNLCAALIQAGQWSQAKEVGSEALPLLRREDAATWLFEHFAYLAWRTGMSDVATQLLGYADRARQAQASVRDPLEQRLQLELHAALPLAVGGARFAELLREGEHLRADQADTLAMQLG